MNINTAMKRFLLAAVLALMAVSCDKNEGQDGGNGSGTIETSYWYGTTPMGDFYLGVEELTDGIRDSSPLEINKEHTNLIKVEVGRTNGMGTGYRNGNTIRVSYLMVYADNPPVPTAFTIGDGVLTCSYADEELILARISEDEFYDSVQSFTRE